MKRESTRPEQKVIYSFPDYVRKTSKSSIRVHFYARFLKLTTIIRTHSKPSRF